MTTYYLYKDAVGNDHCRQLFDAGRAKRDDESPHSSALRHLEKMLLNAVPEDLSDLDAVKKALSETVRVTDNKNVYEALVDPAHFNVENPSLISINDIIREAALSAKVFPVLRHLNFFEHYEYAMSAKKLIEDAESFKNSKLRDAGSMWFYSDTYGTDDTKIAQTIRWDTFLKVTRLHLTDETGQDFAGIEVKFNPYHPDEMPEIDRSNPYFITRDGEQHIIAADSKTGQRLIAEAEKFCEINRVQLIETFWEEKENFEKHLPPKVIPNPHAIYEFTDSEGRHCKKPLLDCSRAEINMTPMRLVQSMLLKRLGDDWTWLNNVDERDPYRFDRIKELIRTPVAFTDGSTVFIAKLQGQISASDLGDQITLALKVIEQPFYLETAEIKRTIDLKKSIPFDKDWDMALRFGDFLPDERNVSARCR